MNLILLQIGIYQQQQKKIYSYSKIAERKEKRVKRKEKGVLYHHIKLYMLQKR